MKFRQYFLLASTLWFLSGCTGFSVPHLGQMKPYTLIRTGDQLGRDQLANRWLVSTKALPIKGRDENEITTLLGQPQDIDSRNHRESEDWYFVYYKRYKTLPDTPEGSFIVRFYNGKVIDVVNLS